MRTMAHEFQLVADQIDLDDPDAERMLQKLGNFQEECEELQASYLAQGHG